MSPKNVFRIMTVIAAAISGIGASNAQGVTPGLSQGSVKTNLVAAESTEKTGEQTLSFSFSGDAPKVKVFQLNNPKKLVLDFPLTDNRSGKGKSGLDLAGLGAKAVDIATDDKRMRVVLAIHENTSWSDRWVGGKYVLSLQRKGAEPTQTLAARTTATPAEEIKTAAAPQKVDIAGKTEASMPAAPSAASAAPAAQLVAEPVSDAQKSDQEILKIEFKKGKSAGSGKLTVDMSDSKTPIDIKSQKNRLVIDFLKTATPTYLQKKFELGELMTPVANMEVKQLQDRTRLIIKMSGAWEQSAYQVENKFVFDIKPVFSETMTGKNADAAYKGDKLTLNFQNIDVRTIIQVLSDFSGINMVASDSVVGNITLRLKDVPWDQALDLLMQARGLAKRDSGNVVWIAPRAEIRAREKDEADFRLEMEQNKVMVTENIQINYQQAANIKTLLSDPSQRILSRRGSAVVDARTNQIFIQDIPDKIADAKAIIKKVDVPVRQVMIEARIVEATENFGKSVGARLGYNSANPGTPAGNTLLGENNNLRYSIGGNLAQHGSNLNQPNAPGTSWDGSYFVNLPSAGAAGFAPAAMSLILFNNAMTRFLNLELSALVSDGKGQILSNPRVVTSDQTEASISQGTQIPYQTTTSSGATATSFAAATLSLTVRPQITPDGNVVMSLNVTKDSVGANTANGPSIDSKRIVTNVLIEDGGTVVVGGVFTQDDSETETRVPFLGDLPYIGFLFKQKTVSRARRELLVFITPKIIGDRNISDDMDVSSSKEEMIKPITMHPDTASGKSFLKPMD